MGDSLQMGGVTYKRISNRVRQLVWESNARLTVGIRLSCYGLWFSSLIECCFALKCHNMTKSREAIIISLNNHCVLPKIMYNCVYTIYLQYL
jgi:hypothetical protein